MGRAWSGVEWLYRVNSMQLTIEFPARSFRGAPTRRVDETPRICTLPCLVIFCSGNRNWLCAGASTILASRSSRSTQKWPFHCAEINTRLPFKQAERGSMLVQLCDQIAREAVHSGIHVWGQTSLGSSLSKTIPKPPLRNHQNAPRWSNGSKNH